jgi:diguanylate cyclase (GGDEF)-like protein
VAVYIVLNAWFTYASPDLRLRLLFGALLAVVWDAANIYLLLRYGQRDTRVSSRLAAAVMAMDATFFIARMLMPLAPDAGNNILRAGTPIATTYIMGLLIGLAGYFSLLLLITERLMVDLRRLARTDPLTGLLNRRAAVEDGTHLLADARRNGLPFALLIFDLDHFKEVNDTWGHDAGDTVLCHVADILRQELDQPRGLACRYGGEEFLLVLPGADLAHALAQAETLRRDLAHSPVRIGERAIRVTTSIGVAAARPDMNFKQLVAQADQALYRAKSEGRNGVTHAPALHPPLYEAQS